MEYSEILLPMALILILSKLLGIFFKKINLPQILGLLVAGILIGFIKFIPGQSILTSFTEEGLSFIGKIGVVLIMFTAGLETNLSDIKKNGIPSLVVTLCGVAFPLLLGFLLSGIFNGFSSASLITNLFYGVLLTSTSVCITVEALKELGKLKGKIGCTIISASILDDIIGIILLSFILGLNKSQGSSAEGISLVVIKTVLFFVLAIGVGIGAKYLFEWLDKKYPHTRRIYIFGLALCFLYAYAAETWFGVSDITGAFLAGLILSRNKEAHEIDRHVEISAYMVFIPIFFANIGMNIDFANFDTDFILFGSLLVLCAIAGKLFGAALGAVSCKFPLKDAFTVGFGMVARAEVLLVCAQKGVEEGIISSEILPFIIIIIVSTSIITPLFLRILLKDKKEKAVKAETAA